MNVMRKMGKEEAKEFCASRCTFLDYSSIEEYVEDIITCLVYSPWHYSEQTARKKCAEGMEFIRRSYGQKIPADDCSVDIGYSCG